MPFIPLPPDVVYTATAVRPQHQELIFDDPNDPGVHQRYTMYTGELVVELDADNHHKDQTFQYPILGTFKDAGGAPAIGIMPIADPNNQFRSAIANASVTSGEFGSNPVWANVGSVSADLMQIQLDSRQTMNAVVLSGILTSRNSRLNLISYRVSVLDRLNGNPPVIPPILIGFAGWTGKYNLVSGGLGPLQKNGIPQDKIDLI